MNKEEYLELQKKRAAAYHSVFSGPNAKVVLEDLNRQFNGTTLKKVNDVIDPNASIAAAGCREVLLYIDNMVTKHASAE